MALLRWERVRLTRVFVSCFSLALFFTVFFVTAVAQAQDAQNETEEGSDQDGTNSAYRYLMGPGDQISIAVFGEEDLSRTVNINELGVISYPFLGDLKAEGKSRLDLEQEITAKLKDGYLVNPVVNVTISKYRVFYVDGYVNNKGSYEFRPGMTVRKAITLAGGFGPRADRDDINVVRGGHEPGGDGTIAAKEVPIGIDDPVYPGDVITVERSFF
jgi:polysaccharide export outer membrane protein